jgi:hypothetical protein
MCTDSCLEFKHETRIRRAGLPQYEIFQKKECIPAHCKASNNRSQAQLLSTFFDPSYSINISQINPLTKISHTTPLFLLKGSKENMDGRVEPVFAKSSYRTRRSLQKSTVPCYGGAGTLPNM